jgi:uncharacterized protein YndB with AHSA1/START domain
MPLGERASGRWASDMTMNMLRIVLWLVGLVVAVGVAVTIVGWLLPVAHVASRSATVVAPPEKVFETIARVDSYQSWWSEISRVEMLPSEDGRTRFRQHTGTGALVMEVTESAPPSRFVTRIADPDQPFGGTWTWEIVPEGSGSRVTITERGEIYNPLFRFMARFVFGYTATMESCLAALTVKG